MAKKYLNINVYDASQKRIEYIFKEFDNVLVAFSGGKDSSVCLNMCYEYARKTNNLDKFAMYHLDYEAQYQMTTDFVEETFKKFNGIKKFWLCLPISAQCCCNMKGGTWIPWEKESEKIWVRKMPDNEYVINENKVPFKFRKGDIDYNVQDEFGKWFEQKYGKTAIVIGIRADESLNRFRAIAKENKNKYKNTNFINGNKAYIIYDWTVEDIWIANAKFRWKYNKIYDLYYQAGLSIEQMRVASPFNDCSGSTLKLYKVIDPKNWGKMVGRVNGVNFLGLYGDTTAMGWKKITKPNNFTWKEYCYFLFNTLDEKTKNHYLEKLNTSIKFWKEKGGALENKTIKEMKDKNIKFKNRGKISKISSKDVISFEEYPDDLDVTNFKEVPTYKRMCVCIIKNDYFCKYMGFAQTKNEIEKRRRAIEKYKNL